MDPEFLRIVDELAVWKFLPSGKDRGTLAIKLAEWCDGHVERARWLADRVDEFDEYPGPKTLRAMIKDKFQPTGALASFDSGPRESIAFECSGCRDSGTVVVDGKHAWCSCESARRMQVEIPQWLTVANRFEPKQSSRIRELQRAAEVRKQLEILERGYGTEDAR